MFSYGYMSLLGLLAGIFLNEHLYGSGGASVPVSKIELGRIGALWLLSSGLASGIMGAITK